MHYYKRNLGDYAKKAGRLSMLQHGSYTLLIDACYDREHFPTLEEAYEWTWASTTEEKEAVAFVLHKFFTVENGVYVQKRIQEEIEEYNSKAQTNKRIAQERETIRRQNNTNRAHIVNESPPNHKPLTKNHKPSIERGSRLPADWNPNAEEVQYCKQTRPDLDPDRVADDFRDYWTAIPGAKGVKLDWSATWRGWVRKQFATGKSSKAPEITVPAKQGPDPALARIIADGLKASKPPENVREKMRELTRK